MAVITLLQLVLDQDTTIIPRVSCQNIRRELLDRNFLAFKFQVNISLSTKRAIGYLRISTPGQAVEHHSSLETQESRYLEYFRSNNLLPVSQFVDVVSGRRDERKEYRRMVEYAMAGNADVIVSLS